MAPKKKRKKSDNINLEAACIIHFPECKDSKTVSINEEKFEKVKQVAELRQAQPAGSSNRFNQICQQIPETHLFDTC